ncbi:cation diffusion facilitator family transporter [Aureibacillus halotolerans]|uniref:Cobalt-zinc-cadmium efflux system protein n=1 Tax=Aureibacillus halotolerans TaxID=1508390 RepID=A0A4R6UDN1_9BACI|nr:cation diffusion facilitator family transporter [Aureibacillus halotolerans]TDQ41204.1 cobalt-zinc-cadmium efflux system protein [Aureibacillus halotolerans]
MNHSHSHSHHHGHDHHHHGHQNKKVLRLSFFIIASFMIVEVIGGFLTNSLALLSDAGHMLSDAAALGLSFFAIVFGEKGASLSKTFGYKRFEILAALINGLTLIGISIYIFVEAITRLLAPPEVVSSGMLIISGIGLLVNIVVAFLLMRGDKEDNLNVRSAFLHVLGDLLGSVGAIVAALLILFFGWSIADPIASIVVAFLIIVSGVRVTKDSFHILMEGVPHGMQIEDVKMALMSLQGIKDVHDLHVWSITSDFPSLSCHLVVEPQVAHQSVLANAQALLKQEFQLEHTTIQIDLADGDCEGTPCN